MPGVKQRKSKNDTPGIVFAGSCSVATQGQVAAYKGMESGISDLL